MWKVKSRSNALGVATTQSIVVIFLPSLNVTPDLIVCGQGLG